MDFNLNEIFPLLIPIIAIAMGIGLAMMSVWTDNERKREMFELHHKERMLAIERGLDVPPLPPEFFASGNKQGETSVNKQLLRALIWLLVGAAVMVALALNRNLESAAWGLIPFAIGLAHLIYYLAVGRQASTATTPGTDAKP